MQYYYHLRRINLERIFKALGCVAFGLLLPIALLCAQEPNATEVEQAEALEAPEIQPDDQPAAEVVVAPQAEKSVPPQLQPAQVPSSRFGRRLAGSLNGVLNKDRSAPVAVPATNATREQIFGARLSGAVKEAVAKEDVAEGKWRLAASAFCRRIGLQRFKAGSYSSRERFEALSKDTHWLGPAGDMNQEGRRAYDNGYVGYDDYTDLDSGTWNWGYSSKGQVKGQTIEFIGVDRVWREHSMQTTTSEAQSKENSDYSGGVSLELERYFKQTKHLDCGLRIGAARARTFESSVSGLNTFEHSQRWETWRNKVVDTYDISGTDITPSSEPYRGNQQNSGPVIDTTPMHRRSLGGELVSVETYRAYNSISETLDVDLTTFSLGLSVKGKYRRLNLGGSTGPTFNLVEKDADYTEILYESRNGAAPGILRRWDKNDSGTECLFGYYVQGEIMVTIYKGLQAGIFGRYDWIEDVFGDVGESRYQIRLAGGTIGGTIGWQF